MRNEILRVRLTHNLRQLKKYVDLAIEKGAESIYFDMRDSGNQYFNFMADFTPEQEQEFMLKNIKEEYSKKISDLEKQNYKTHSFRRKEYGLCGADVQKMVEDFVEENKIKNYMQNYVEKKVINNEYDDYDDGMITIFITEIIEKQD